MSQRITDRDKSHRDKEQRTSEGNIIALACGPLKKKRYINPKIELELVEFKKEIEDKFAKSAIKKFVMPKQQFNESTDVHDTKELTMTGIFN